MSTPGPRDNEEPNTAPGDDDDSVVSPPAYPAYSTPPPEGLAGNEDG